jgi:short-subunit dehydrogenase
MKKYPLEQQRIWITGASSGIGKTLAIALANRGNEVIISGRSRDRLEETQSHCPDHLFPLPFDVVSQEANQMAARQIREQFNGLDIAILNAGTCEYVDVNHFDVELIRRVTEINYLGFVYGVGAALPLLREGEGRYLVGMSSSVAYTGLPMAEAYGSTKAAIRHFLQALRIDLTRDAIDVSIICPGFVKTPLTDLNEFHMPMRISPEKAARYIIRGMERHTHEIRFPPLFVTALRLLSILPSRLRTSLFAHNMEKQDSPGE